MVEGGCGHREVVGGGKLWAEGGCGWREVVGRGRLWAEGGCGWREVVGSTTSVRSDGDVRGECRVNVKQYSS